VDVSRKGDREAVIGFEQHGVTPDRDFELYYATRTGSDIALNLMTYHDGDDADGPFLLLASPGLDVKDDQVIRKDVVFVVDTSGPMAGEKLAQAKRALRFCVANLNRGDRFQIVRFSTEAESLFDGVVDASADNRKRATEFIENFAVIGGTAIEAALLATVKRLKPGDRPSVVIFLTDGRPTVGTTDEDQILASATEAGGKKPPRVFCFGIGTDISSPVLTDASLEWDGPVRIQQMCPAPLPNLFKGDQLVVLGRYTGHGRVSVALKGKVNGAVKALDYEAHFAKAGADGGHAFIPRLWATHRVGYLLDQIRLHVEHQELRDEVAQLARRYGIVTPYTAYLILEDERDDREQIASDALLPMSPMRGRRTQVRDLRRNFEAMSAERSGARAVRTSVESRRLKAAETMPGPIAGKQFVRARSDSHTWGMPETLEHAGPAGAARNELIPRYVGGKTFYRHSDGWVDATIADEPDAKREKIKFGSNRYFKLMERHANARSWLAVGPQVQVVIGGTIYEIVADA